MNIKISFKWLKEYLDTRASVDEIQKYLSLCGPSVEAVNKIGDDHIFDIEITSNRIDTVSVYGIAREAAAILTRFGIKARLKKLTPKKTSLPADRLPLTIEDKENLCYRLMAVVMDNVQIRPSPDYILNRLEKSGVRALNNLVDITNYLMLELGQPSHVFDYDRIKTGKLILRKAKIGETLVTLDGKKCQLTPEDVIIDDGTGRIIDLPGIMGTENSVVTPKTKRIVFFMESNNPTVIRRTSMRLNLRSLAATINEKGPDIELLPTVINRGIELFQKYASAKLASRIFDIYPNKVKISPIVISTDFINSRLGVKITFQEVVNILTSLGFTVEKKPNQQLKITSPTFRYPDVTIAEDIVEEVARLYGYHRLPSRIQPSLHIKQPKQIEQMLNYQLKIKYFLKHLGLNEVMNYSMISRQMIENAGLKLADHLKIKNTISQEIEYMRLHLAPSLIKNIKDNEGRREMLRLFEIAKTYKPKRNDLPDEKYKLGLVTNTDFSDLKGIIDALLAEFHLDNCEIIPANHPLLAKDKQGAIFVEGIRLGEFGQLSQKYQLKNKIKSPVFLAVFDLESFISHSKPLVKFQPINPFAQIKLDLTIQLTSKRTFAKVKQTAFTKSKLLVKLALIDRFQNKITLRFYFGAKDRNITLDEAKKELKTIENNLKELS